MWRELERGFWQRTDNGWSTHAGSEAEAQLLYEQRLVARDAEHRTENARVAVRVMKIPEYKPIIAAPRRKLVQPAFKLPIDTLRDMQLRLQGCVIYVGPEPVAVSEVVQIGKEFWLVFHTAEGEQYRLNYSHAKIDCRSAEPQYIVYSHAPSFLFRFPARHQKQGMDSGNMGLKEVGSTIDRVSRIHDYGEVCRALKKQNDLSWSEQYCDLMVKADAFRSLRLSPEISFYKNKKTVMAEYKGRNLGVVFENQIKVDEYDFGRPWIKEAVLKIGCEIRK